MQEMEELKKKSQAELDRYQEKYRQLLDQIVSENNEILNIVYSNFTHKF